MAAVVAATQVVRYNCEPTANYIFTETHVNFTFLSEGILLPWKVLFTPVRGVYLTFI